MESVFDGVWVPQDPLSTLLWSVWGSQDLCFKITSMNSAITECGGLLGKVFVNLGRWVAQRDRSLKEPKFIRRKISIDTFRSSYGMDCKFQRGNNRWYFRTCITLFFILLQGWGKQEWSHFKSPYLLHVFCLLFLFLFLCLSSSLLHLLLLHVLFTASKVQRTLLFH